MRLFSAVCVTLAALMIAPVATADEDASPRPTVVVGVGGLLWSDISESNTPNLHALIADGDFGSLSVRTEGEITCPADGWTTMSTGRRTLGAERGSDPVCNFPSVKPTTEGGARVDIDEIQSLNKESGWKAVIGELGNDLHAENIDAMAVGEGAALALLDSAGTVKNYSPTLDDFLDNNSLRTYDVAVIDLGNVTKDNLTTDTASRSEQLATVDQRAGELRTALQDSENTEPDVFLIGVSSAASQAHLTVMAHSPVDTTASTMERSVDGPAWLRAQSTRRTGLIHITDINPTLRAAVDIPESVNAVGAPAYPYKERGDTDAAIEKLSIDDSAANVIRSSLAPIMIVLVALLLITAATAWRLRSKNKPEGTAPAWVWHSFAALTIAPLATFVGSVMPWERITLIPLPVSLALTTLVSWALLSTLIICGPWRRHLLGPLAASGLLTGFAIVVDTLIGSPMQWMSPLGDTPLVGGRFYGISNPPYALAFVGLLMGLAIIADPLRRRFGSRAPVTAVIIFGAAFTIFVASPTAGSNVGGTIAAVPGFTILAMLVSRVRITWSRFGFMIVGGLFMFMISALIDYAQPADERAHLGRFIARTTQGELPSMIWRKIEASFTIVAGSVLVTIIAIAVTTAIGAIIVFPRWWRFTSLATVYEHAPTLQAGVASSVIGVGVAVLTNDSGVALAFIALLLIAPMLGTALVRYPTSGQVDLTRPSPPAQR